MTSTLIRLHESDNVVVCKESLQQGDEIEINGIVRTIEHFLTVGHKLAYCDIHSGDPIIKFGITIGTAVENISTGMHIHTHNIKSNYIPTYLIQ